MQKITLRTCHIYMAEALIQEFLIGQLEIATIRDSPNSFIQVIPKDSSVK